MTAIHPVAGKLEVCRRIGEALGITEPWSRLVIEIDVCKGPMTAYVTSPVQMKRAEALAHLLEVEQVASVTVNADSSLTVVPLAPPE